VSPAAQVFEKANQVTAIYDEHRECYMWVKSSSDEDATPIQNIVKT
jgi:hypothetical protein